MRTDPLPTSAYSLVGDNVTIGYVTRATFPTLQLFEFDASLLFDQRFLDSLSNRGYLPVTAATRLGEAC